MRLHKAYFVVVTIGAFEANFSEDQVICGLSEPYVFDTRNSSVADAPSKAILLGIPRMPKLPILLRYLCFREGRTGRISLYRRTRGEVPKIEIVPIDILPSLKAHKLDWI